MKNVSHEQRQFYPARDEFSVEPLRIAVINNVADSGLSVTERQFCSLLHPASLGMLVDLKFYSLPGLPRGDAGSAHVSRFYEPYEELEHSNPHGVIVTGAEPKMFNLKDETVWPALAKLIDWVESREIPGIWSCMAAHAAVLQMDGIERVPLERKLSGVFECAVSRSRHQVLHRMPRKWRVPHSRRNGLSRSALEAHGYDVVSFSRDAGVDVFLKQDRGLQLFLQGHPEYDPERLLAEYHRDRRRAAKGDVQDMVLPPVGLNDASSWRAWRRLAPGRQMRKGSSVLMAEQAERLEPKDYWSDGARTLFANWLAHLATRQSRMSGWRVGKPATAWSFADRV